MRIISILLALAVYGYSQLPSWLSSRPAAGAGVQPLPAAAEKPKTVVKTVRDTITIMDTVTVTDTVTIIDTIVAWPVQYKYNIRYALCNINISTDGVEWHDYSSFAEIVARDTATLRVGSEDLVFYGNIIDQFGNRLPQYNLITTGFTISVQNDRAVIEYRGKNSVAFFSGSFDPSGYLVATGEIEDSGLLANMFPFSLFFGSNRKKVIIEIVREVFL